MLTGDLLRASIKRSKVEPRYVGRPDPERSALVFAPELLALAEELIGEFVAHAGKSRGELRAALEGRARAGDRVRLERGLSKLLADRSDFERSSELDPEAVRALVFTRAAEARREGKFDRDQILAAAASALGGAGHPERSAPVSSREVEIALEADRKTRERLIRFEPIEPRVLLERYDVALAQAVLLRAVRVTVSLEARPKRIRDVLRAVKFRRLLFSASKEKKKTGAERSGSRIRLELDGPLSLFESSTKYGLLLAEVLPEILLCERFELEAELAWGKNRFRKYFTLSSEDGLRSPKTDTGAAPPPELEAFASHFDKTGEGWKVTWDPPLVRLGGELVVPDIGFVHESGATGALELIANARRGSLPGRLALLREHAPRGLVVAVAKNLLEEGESLPAGVVVYRSMLYRSMPSAEDVRANLNSSLLLVPPRAPRSPSSPA
jgi:predicted nuclease of restriction endonuclease-like RecB superfamily